MKKEQVTVTYNCDICGEEMKLWEVSETQNCAVVSLTSEVWYGGFDEHKDICESCSGKIYQLLSELKKGTK